MGSQRHNSKDHDDDNFDNLKEADMESDSVQNTRDKHTCRRSLKQVQKDKENEEALLKRLERLRKENTKLKKKAKKPNNEDEDENGFESEKRDPPANNYQSLFVSRGTLQTATKAWLRHAGDPKQPPGITASPHTPDALQPVTNTRGSSLDHGADEHQGHTAERHHPAASSSGLSSRMSSPSRTLSHPSSMGYGHAAAQ
ncbi:hypothetical protein SCP_1002250 [Sparassis crispa]|uniref:Uncharacterized protein n=1 Tax=Sparassis crispa TaxID=139825 RepID=A0A401GXU4_9APHY|nr:hypothetical protein SCP_1002250 [Sparassis crispa]GBE86979.1 hypothetical protein SCP_1002250 [Sparassis crispa]